MKISLHWIRSLVPVTADVNDIADKLTIHTAEVEEVIELRPFYEKVIAGKLTKADKVDGSDKLSVGQWDLGKLGMKQIVFGNVHPLEVGGIYPLAIDGAKLMSGINIKDREVKGIASEGMVCDNTELGMKNDRLIRFPDNTELGKSMADLYPECRDTLIDIDNKSLTHRPDLMGHIGFAREFGALYGLDFVSPKSELPNTSGTELSVKIETENCFRFMAVQINNITDANWDLGTQMMLEHLGTRSISPIVDVTNTMLLFRGQPMHGFDADKVQGGLTIRQAKKGEYLIALDEEEYELSAQDIVVCDEHGPISIAGVMGGQFSGVTEQTKNIVYECAVFDAATVRKTSARLGLRSESSMRYEKSLDPENTALTLAHALEITQKMAPNAVIQTGISDNYPAKQEPLVITLSPDHVRRIMGVDIGDNQIREILESLEFHVTDQDGTFNVTVPSFRATKDIGIPEDLIEEVVRIYGYNQIKGSVPLLPVLPPMENPLRKLHWKLSDFFVDRGYYEVQHYSFVDSLGASFTEMDDYVVIENPLSAHHTHMRRSLMTNIVKHLDTELNEVQEKFVCEFGRVFEQETNSLPLQPWHMALCGSSKIQNETALFERIRMDIDTLMKRLGIAYEIKQSNTEIPAFAHPNKTGIILVNGNPVGYLGMLHPMKNPRTDTTICFAEINMEQLLEATGNYAPYIPGESKLIERDISLVLGAKVPTGSLVQSALESDPSVSSVDIFDVYSDESVFGPDKKSVGIRVRINGKTKKSDDIFVQIEQNLCKEFGGVLHKEFTN